MSRPSDDFHVYDTTLRDGAQREGISYSVADKLKVAKLDRKSTRLNSSHT